MDPWTTTVPFLLPLAANLLEKPGLRSIECKSHLRFGSAPSWCHLTCSSVPCIFWEFQPGSHFQVCWGAQIPTLPGNGKISYNPVVCWNICPHLLAENTWWLEEEGIPALPLSLRYWSTKQEIEFDPNFVRKPHIHAHVCIHTRAHTPL